MIKLATLNKKAMISYDSNSKLMYATTVLLLFACSVFLVFETTARKYRYERSVILTNSNHLLKTYFEEQGLNSVKNYELGLASEDDILQELINRAIYRNKQLDRWNKNMSEYEEFIDGRTKEVEYNLKNYIEFLRYTIFSFALSFIALIIYRTRNTSNNYR